MKIRQGFVSNSSSSSFLVLGERPKDCEYVQLTEAQARSVLGYMKTREYDPYDINWDDWDNVFLTQFISDAGTLYYNINGYNYKDGNHCGPYWEEDYDILKKGSYNGVWILKEHNKEEK